MHEEHALQAFRRRDKDQDGFISTLDFYEIMTLLKGHLLTNFVKENLLSVGLFVSMEDVPLLWW